MRCKPHRLKQQKTVIFSNKNKIPAPKQQKVEKQMVTGISPRYKGIGVSGDGEMIKTPYIWR